MRSTNRGPAPAVRANRLPVVLGLALAFGLPAGCTGDRDPGAAPAATGTTVSAVSAEPGRPQVGQCRANGSLAVKDARLDEQAVVACTAPHGLETWRVGALPEPYGPAAPYPPDDAAYGELADAANKVCGFRRGPHGAGEDLAFLGVTFGDPEDGAVRQSVTPYDGYFFTPSPAQWSEGARWVRCDVGLEWDDPTGSLTGTLEGVHQSPPPGGIAPLCSAGNHWVGCDAPHKTEVLSRYVAVAGERPGAGDDEVDLRWRNQCRRDAMAYLGLTMADQFAVSVYPATSQSRWAAGDHTVECWLEYPDPFSIDRNARPVMGSARLRGHAVPPTAGGA